MRYGGLKAAVVALALMCAVRAGAEYEAGQRAWEAGQRDAAILEWRAGADAGEAGSMLALGRLYLQGLGVPQNYVQAHTWFNLAASRGEAAAIAERDALAAKMTPDALAEAQKLALVWQPSDKQTRASTAPAPAAKSDGAIREAQRLLAALGYQPGPADGLWGGRTLEAWRAFLRDTGQPQTDTLTPEALSALRSIAQRQGIGPAQPARPASAQPAQRQIRPDALHRAVQAGDITGLHAILATGADVNARDVRGWTALMHAANQGYMLLVPPLLEAQADLNVRAADGATVLFIAVLHGYTEIVAALLAAGVDISIRGPRGKTVLEVAKVREHSEITTLLEPVWYDNAAFEQAKSAGTWRAYGNYIQAYPEGRHISEARRLRAAIAEAERPTYEGAQSAGTLEAYKQYLESSPQGPFRDDALGGLNTLLAPNNAGVEIGQTFRDCQSCPEMVIVPAGAFLMGDLSGGGDDNERPVRVVTITRPFAVGRYEVTFMEWDACTAERGCNRHRPRDRGWGRALRPVIYVNWEDTQAYASWLSRETGKTYRLPSEAEWEYIARARTTTKYWWGDEIGRLRANCDGCSSQWDNEKTAPVGAFQPNGFGLYDVHGNVWEWVQDCWNGSYAGAPRDGRAWTTGGCSRRVRRGGSWYNVPGNLRSANRSGSSADNRNHSLGFRIARSLP